METSQDLYRRYQEAMKEEAKVRDKAREEARAKLHTYRVFQITHRHKECDDHFRGGTVHLLRVSQVLDLTQDEQALLGSEAESRGGTYYYEGGKLSMRVGQCFWDPCWRWGRPTRVPAEREAKEGTDLLALEGLLVNWVDSGEETVIFIESHHKFKEPQRRR